MRNVEFFNTDLTDLTVFKLTIFFVLKQHIRVIRAIRVQ